jgi:hypothetical protein
LFYRNDNLFEKKTGTKEYDENNKVLKNGVTFEGVVTDIKISRNHSFGILTVNVFNSNVKEFSKKLVKGYIRIKSEEKMRKFIY